LCLKRVFFLIATINFIFSTLNAQVVTNGLLLYVNAGNSTSYPGNGSKWFDLSGQNNDGTITDATFSSANKWLDLYF
tara:strand:+ start:487 stop:717 length:231 start_codon:yes stop_codon:yes gene_type:complete